MVKETKIVIDTKGGVKIETDGYSGQGCSKDIDKLMANIGSVKTRNKKPEYYQGRVVDIHNE